MIYLQKVWHFYDTGGKDLSALWSERLSRNRRKFHIRWQIMCREVGFKTADEIASKVGIHTDSDYRIRSGILLYIDSECQ